MNYSFRLSTIICAFICMLMSITSQVKAQDFDYGSMVGQTYINSFFKMNITFPEDWSIQSQDVLNGLAKEGRDLVAGDDENYKANLEASQVNSANLFGVFRYPVGTPASSNPNILSVAENLNQAPHIESGGDYLLQTRRLLLNSQIQFDQLDETFEQTLLAGKMFYTLNLQMNVSGIRIKQRYYSTIINGFSLNFIITFIADEEEKQLQDILNTLEFD